MVLSTVCGIFGLYVLVIIWARKADMLDDRKVRCLVGYEMSEMLQAHWLLKRTYRLLQW